MKSLKNKWHQFCLPVLCILCSNMVSAEVFRQHIHENWMFKQARLNNWYKADVPGVVHTDKSICLKATTNLKISKAFYM